ncbi:MAG: hypothetical protein QOE61_2258 [Micromonosporaceae bacterium]|jgi:hypothetical protein|nr:hypothetical protein [Micromonosporaceae bacterium]
MAGETPVLVHNCDVTLYRNVDGREFDAIASSGKFETGAGQMEGKWFATTKEHADKWGEALNGGDSLTVQVRVPKHVADQLHQHPGKLDGIGPGMYADADKLDLINRMGRGIELPE